MIVGVTGMPCSGSNAVGDILVETYAFVWLSYSDVLRDILSSKGEEVTREAMQRVGNNLRYRYGAGELSKRLLARMESGKNYVVGTLRNPAEVEILRTAGSFVLVHVHASPEIRFKRIASRNRERDPQTWEAFMALESQEEGKGQEAHGLRIADCIAMADHTISNEGSLEELKAKVNTLFTRIKVHL